MPKRKTRKNLKKSSKRNSRKNLRGSGPAQSKDNTMPKHCKGKSRARIMGKYCDNPNVTDKKCECVPGSTQNKKAMKKQSVPQSDKTPCKSKSCCRRKTCHADVEKCDKEGLVPCPKMPGCELVKKEGYDKPMCEMVKTTTPTATATTPKKKKPKKKKARAIECFGTE